jgi:mannosyltransferase
VAQLDLTARASRLWLLAPLGAGLLAAALGSLLIGRKALSTDEAFAVFVARQNLGDVLGEADSRLGQLAHLLVVHPIARVNDAEWAVRAPSVVAAALAAALLYVLGAHLFGRAAGAVAAFALASSAGVVSAAQLARPYTLALLGIVLSTLLFVLAWERAAPGLTVAYAGSALLLPLLHPAAASVLAAHLAAALVDSRRSWVFVAVPAAGIALAAPLLAVAASQRAEAPDDADFSLGELAEGIARGAGWNPVLVVLAALGVIAAAVRLRDAALWKAVLVGGLALAPLLALLLTALALPVFPTRVVVLAAPGLALAAGAAVVTLTERIALAAVGTVAAIAVAALALTYAVGPDEDWRRAAGAVRLVTKPRETVVVVPERARPAFAYYAHDISTSLVARGDAAWVVVRADTPVEAIELGRTVVPTPRYALRRQFRYGDGLRLQHWIRP